MTDDLPPWAKDFTPRQNAPKSVANEPLTCAIDAGTLLRLESLTKPKLIALIRRVSGAMWGIGVMTEEETYEAMLLKLAINGLSSADAKDALSNIREWLDRKQGKATHRIEQKIESTNKTLFTEMTADELSSILRQAHDQRVLPKGITLLSDGNVDFRDVSYDEVGEV